MFVIKTNRFIPQDLHARAVFFLVLVRPEKAGDFALIEHEKVHVRQWAAALCLGLLAAFVLWECPPASRAWSEAVAIVSPFLHGWLYRYYPRYRLWAEVQAYRRQMECYEYGEQFRPLAARYLSQHYNLGISEADALKRL